MKSFLKMLLASILGGGILLFLIFILFASLASISSPELEVQENTVLHINLNNTFVDRAQNNPFESFDPFSGQTQSYNGLTDILAALNAGAEDPKIKGVYLSGGLALGGQATLREVREALLKFRESGKFVYGYTELLTQKGLYLATAADTFLVNPEGIIELGGLSASVSYYREALEKIGVKPVIFRATGNKFKSAVEPFMLQEMSDENRAQLTELLGSIWTTYLEELASARNLSASDINTLADSLLTDPKLAAEVGLIAGTAYEDQLQEKLAVAVGVEKYSQINFIKPGKYAKGLDIEGDQEYSENRVAVIIAQGDIQSGEGGEYTIGSDRIAEAVRKARLNKKVKAVVLRVNSPGGSALASDVIWREIMLTKQEKPVIASMGDVAASGGYYISCFADTILAQPNTITGSIGAFGLFFTAEELMHEKLGINIETVKTNRYGDLGTLDRDITPSEKRIFVRQIDQVYSTFTSRVSEGRGMSIERVNELGQGRVYSGTKALELGLVDMLGGLEDAIALAAEKAGISEDYSVVDYPEMADPFEELLKEFSENMAQSQIDKELGELSPHYQGLKEILSRRGLQTRMEYDLVIE